MNLSEEFKSLIDSMLSSNPAQRPTYSDLIMHPWLASVNEDCTLEQACAWMADRKAHNEYERLRANEQFFLSPKTKIIRE